MSGHLWAIVQSRNKSTPAIVEGCFFMKATFGAAQIVTSGVTTYDASKG
jgi:hypothetical protein